VGDLTVRRCAEVPLTYCGGLAVPLDYSSAASPDIHIGFRWLRGGRVRFSGGNVLRISLSNVRWAINATIDGIARWTRPPAG
jgi:hypothetical protein